MGRVIVSRDCFRAHTYNKHTHIQEGERERMSRGNHIRHHPFIFHIMDTYFHIQTLHHSDSGFEYGSYIPDNNIYELYKYNNYYEHCT